MGSSFRLAILHLDFSSQENGIDCCWWLLQTVFVSIFVENIFKSLLHELSYLFQLNNYKSMVLGSHFDIQKREKRYQSSIF